MKGDQTQLTAECDPGPSPLVLGVDTCGPQGSVALGRLRGGSIEILGQTELEGRSYSATLVAGVADLLAGEGAKVRNLGAIVAVNGPGSFTGVRVGLSAVKGLAEAARIPVVAVSRLEVLAAMAGTGCAALDAHRREVYLRLAATDGPARELLAGVEELADLERAGASCIRVAVCEGGAVELLGRAWPGAELAQADAPTAADALTLCAERLRAGAFVDVELLDGHYLRRSDAEIFAPAAKVRKP